jgi:hypothetical protein
LSKIEKQQQFAQHLDTLFSQEAEDWNDYTRQAEASQLPNIVSTLNYLKEIKTANEMVESYISDVQLLRLRTMYSVHKAIGPFAVKAIFRHADVEDDIKIINQLQDDVPVFASSLATCFSSKTALKIIVNNWRFLRINSKDITKPNENTGNTVIISKSSAKSAQEVVQLIVGECVGRRMTTGDARKIVDKYKSGNNYALL